MNTIEHLKVITAEELGELISAATKCQTYLFKNLRFGDRAISPINQIPSFQEVVQEAADVIAMLEMLSEEYCDNQIFDRDRIEAKKEKVRLMMERARQHLAIDPPAKQRVLEQLIPKRLLIEDFKEAVTSGDIDLFNGVGYWATDQYECTLQVNFYPQPEWATHVCWYPMNSI